MAFGCDCADCKDHCACCKQAELLLHPVILLPCRGESKSSSDMQVYGTSKLYNIMVAKALNEKLKGTGVEAFSAHPGQSHCQPPVLLLAWHSFSISTPTGQEK